MIEIVSYSYIFGKWMYVKINSNLMNICSWNGISGTHPPLSVWAIMKKCLRRANLKFVICHKICDPVSRQSYFTKSYIFSEIFLLFNKLVVNVEQKQRLSEAGQSVEDLSVIISCDIRSNICHRFPSNPQNQLGEAIWSFETLSATSRELISGTLLNKLLDYFAYSDFACFEVEASSLTWLKCTKSYPKKLHWEVKYCTKTLNKSVMSWSSACCVH